jgi:preprotein translocase subunit SecY
MWLGELISERKVGNGMSILILAGIISGFPKFIQQTAATYTSADLTDMILFAALLIFTIVSVVIITEGQRNIPVQYARGQRGGTSQRVQSHLPMRLNMGGMIPIIFAIAMIVFPPLVAQFFLNARTQVLRDIAAKTLVLFGNQLFYGVIFFTLVFAFTYFYASVVFKSDTIAENLQKQGGFIPGIRPGVETQVYLERVKNRLLLTGATFLAVIAVLPIIVQQITGSQNLVVGGSSVIILVGVIVDMMKQIDSQISLREYEVK